MNWKKVSLVLGGFLVLIPLFNLIGWYGDHPGLYRFNPAYPPATPFNSILHLLAAGSLLASISESRRLGFAMAGMLSVVALSLVVGLVSTHVWSGSLSANLTVCFVLTAAGLLIMNHSIWFRRQFFVVGLVGTVISAIGGMGLVGYLFSIEPAYSWGAFANMSLYSDLVFGVMGLVMMALAWRNRDVSKRELMTSMAAICLAVGMGTASLVFWQALSDQEESQMQKSVAFHNDILESEIRGEMRLRIQAVERLAKRWEVRGRPAMDEWIYEADQLMRNLRGFQAMAWADSDFQAVWIAPDSGNTGMANQPLVNDSTLAQALASAGRDAGVRVSHPFTLPRGGRGILIFESVSDRTGVNGYLMGVVSLSALFEVIVPESILGEYEVAIYDDRERLYPKDFLANRSSQKWISTSSVNLPGTHWTLELQPRGTLLERELTNLPDMVLVGGLAIALLMAVSVFYAQRSNQNSSRLTQVNRELAISRESFANIVHRNSDGIVVTDGQGMVRFANPSAVQLLGLSMEKLIGNACPFPLVAGQWQEMTFNNSSGSGKIVLAISMANTDWEGKPAIISSLRDVTERARTRDALRQSEAKLRRLVDSKIVGVFFTDAEGLVREANDAFLGLLGYATDGMELDGLSWKSLVSPGFIGLHEKALREIQSHGTSAPHEILYRRKDGGEIWIMEAAADLGEGLGIVVLIVDIHDYKVTEAALKKNEEQLRQSQKMESLGRLAGGISHDFNNLLTAINGYSEMLLGTFPENSPDRTYIEEILSAGEKAAALTGQLLAFSRKQVVIPKVLDVGAVITEMVSLMRRLIGEHVGLHVVLDEAKGRIKSDAGLIQQVVLNLAINARDAMPGGGEIHIETSTVELGEEVETFHLPASPGRYVAIMVKDSGKGMDETVRSHLFEPFFSTKEKGKGTGLGLSTVYGIVKQFRGAIRIETEMGRGTVFTVFFPLVAGEVAPSTPMKQPYLPSRDRGKENVLLVEDEELVLRMAKRILEEKGYQVTSASNAGEALAYLRGSGERIDLLLTDIVLPGMNGRELAVQARGVIPGLRVVFMSGYAEDLEITKEVQTPGTAFLAKPFSPDALARIVRQTLDAVFAEA